MLLTVSSGMNSFLQFCTVLIIFIFVLVITWFATKWVANMQKEKSIGVNIEVIETCRLTTSQYVQIIRAGEKYLAVAICKDTITMLAEIPAEQLHLSEKPPEAMPDFKKIFERVKHTNKNQKNEE